MTCCTIWEKFDEENNLVKEYEYWRVLVRNRYMSLGNCLVISKRHTEKFSDLDADEMEEFRTVVRELEHALENSFAYDKINWLMLMMKDKHTHFHVIPRYESERDFAGKKWVDAGWPSWPAKSELMSDKELLRKIREVCQRSGSIFGSLLQA